MSGKRPEPSFEFVQLLTSHQSRLYAYVLSLLGNRTQAEDVMQETNAVLWRKAHDFKLGTNFGAWMLKVAHFQVMAHRRKLTRDRLGPPQTQQDRRPGKNLEKANSYQ